MFKIDSPGATEDKRFTEGDPNIPIPATVVSAEWLNMVQDELENILKAAGLDPSKPDNAQVAQSVQSLIAAKVLPFSQYGILPYSPTVDYPQHGRCMDAEGVIKKAVQPSGPGTDAGAQPTTNEEFWETVDAVIQTAGAATETGDGTPAGTVILAADSDTVSRDKAATPAGVAAQVAEGTPYKVSAIITEALSLPAGAYTTLTFETKESDEAGMLDAATGIFTIAEAGLYLLTGALELSGANNNATALWAYNGITPLKMIGSGKAYGSSNSNAVVSSVVELAAGAQFNFRVFPLVSSTVVAGCSVQLTKT